MVMNITGVDYEEAEQILNLTNQKVKPAIVMIKGEVTLEEANQYILDADDFVHKAIQKAKGG